MDNIIYKKITFEEFKKLRTLFPDSEELWNKYSLKRTIQFHNEEVDVFVLEKNNEFIGEVTAHYLSGDNPLETIPRRRVYLSTFRLLDEYQNIGLGQKLINYALDSLMQDGYTEFTIGVEENNEIAKHIYNKLGFTKEIARGTGNEFDPSDYILYLKD